MGVSFSREMTELIESGVSILVGTRDAALVPDCMRGIGAAVLSSSRVALYLYEPLAKRAIANIADNGLLAVTFSRIIDHRSIQLKGRVIQVRAATLDDEALSQRYLIAFSEQVALAGMPRSVIRRVHTSPGVVVELEATDAFLQTPGPGAGRRMGEPA